MSRALEPFISRKMQLTLEMKGESFIRGESLLIEVSIKNCSNGPLQIEELNELNNPLTFSGKSGAGKRFSGSLNTFRSRDGLMAPPALPKTHLCLQSGERISLRLDLLNVVGELPEGQYSFEGVYRSGLLMVLSNRVTFDVVRANPIYSKAVQDLLRSSINTIRTAWINKEETGLYLFIMENSQYYPPRLVSNRRILKIEESVTLYPSLLSSPDSETEHLIWFDGNKARVATVSHERLKGVEDVKFQYDDPKFLEPSITTEDSKLHFLLLTHERGKTAVQLVTFAASSDMATKEICSFLGTPFKHSVVYDEDLRAHLAWSSNTGEIHYIWFDLDETSLEKREPQILFESEEPIADLQLSIACVDISGNLQLLLNLVSYASPTKLHSRLIKVDTRRELTHSFHELPELRNLTLLETILDLDCRPHFLFFDGKGALWFKSFADPKPMKVTQEDESYHSNVDYPKLLLSSKESSNYGIYLRYTKGKERFVCRKLKSLE